MGAPAAESNCCESQNQAGDPQPAKAGSTALSGPCRKQPRQSHSHAVPAASVPLWLSSLLGWKHCQLQATGGVTLLRWSTGSVVLLAPHRHVEAAVHVHPAAATRAIVQYGNMYCWIAGPFHLPCPHHAVCDATVTPSSMKQCNSTAAQAGNGCCCASCKAEARRRLQQRMYCSSPELSTQSLRPQSHLSM